MCTRRVCECSAAVCCWQPACAGPACRAGAAASACCWCAASAADARAACPLHFPMPGPGQRCCALQAALSGRRSVHGGRVQRAGELGGAPAGLCPCPFAVCSVPSCAECCRTCVFCLSETCSSTLVTCQPSRCGGRSGQPAAPQLAGQGLPAWWPRGILAPAPAPGCRAPCRTPAPCRPMHAAGDRCEAGAAGGHRRRRVPCSGGGRAGRGVRALPAAARPSGLQRWHRHTGGCVGRWAGG